MKALKTIASETTEFECQSGDGSTLSVERVLNDDRPVAYVRIEREDYHGESVYLTRKGAAKLIATLAAFIAYPEEDEAPF